MPSKCTKCGSSNLKRLNAEISFAFGKNPPVYMLEKPTVCLDCGFTECFVAKEALAQIRDNLLAS